MGFLRFSRENEPKVTFKIGEVVELYVGIGCDVEIEVIDYDVLDVKGNPTNIKKLYEKIPVHYHCYTPDVNDPLYNSFHEYIDYEVTSSFAADERDGWSHTDIVFSRGDQVLVLFLDEIPKYVVGKWPSGEFCVTGGIFIEEALHWSGEWCTGPLIFTGKAITPAYNIDIYTRKDNSDIYWGFFYWQEGCRFRPSHNPHPVGALSNHCGGNCGLNLFHGVKRFAPTQDGELLGMAYRPKWDFIDYGHVLPPEPPYNGDIIALIYGDVIRYDISWNEEENIGEIDYSSSNQFQFCYTDLLRTFEYNCRGMYWGLDLTTESGSLLLPHLACTISDRRFNPDNPYILCYDEFSKYDIRSGAAGWGEDFTDPSGTRKCKLEAFGLSNTYGVSPFINIVGLNHSSLAVLIRNFEKEDLGGNVNRIYELYYVEFKKDNWAIAEQINQWSYSVDEVPYLNDSELIAIQNWYPSSSFYIVMKKDDIYYDVKYYSNIYNDVIWRMLGTDPPEDDFDKHVPVEFQCNDQSDINKININSRQTITDFSVSNEVKFYPSSSVLTESYPYEVITAGGSFHTQSLFHYPLDMYHSYNDIYYDDGNYGIESDFIYTIFQGEYSDMTAVA